MLDDTRLPSIRWFEEGRRFLKKPFGTTCLPDINNDGTVDVLDLIDMLLCFGLPANLDCAAVDINGDGVIDVLDLIELLLEFGAACP